MQLVREMVIGVFQARLSYWIVNSSYLKPYGEDKTKDPSIFCLIEGEYFQPRLNIGNIREMQISKKKDNIYNNISEAELRQEKEQESKIL